MKRLILLLPFLLFACSSDSGLDDLPEPTPVKYDHAVMIMEVCPTNGKHQWHDLTLAGYEDMLRQIRATNEYCVKIEVKSMTTNRTVTGWYGGSVAP